MKRPYVLLLSFLLSFSCNSEEHGPTLPGIEPTKIWLKHLTTTEAIVSALGDYAEGWDVDELQLTRDEGLHPTLTWNYQSILSMRTDGADVGTHHYRRIRITTDGPFELEEIKELEESQNRVRVNDARMDKYPNLYLNKRRENDNNNWSFDFYAHQMHENGNRTTHIINLSGGHSVSYIEGTIPPPTDREVVSAIFGLLEERD